MNSFFSASPKSLLFFSLYGAYCTNIYATIFSFLFLFKEGSKIYGMVISIIGFLQISPLNASTYAE